MSVWYYAKGNNQAGPVSPDQLRQLIASGALSTSDRVWKDGMAVWAPIGSVPELAGAAPAAASEPPYAAPAAAVPSYGAPEQLSYATPLGMSSGGVMATGRSLEMLRQTKPWVRFLSIVTLIGVCLLVVAGMIIMFMGSSRSTDSTHATQGGVMIFMACIYGAAALLMSRYASAIDQTLKSRREADLEAALAAQKSFWKFSGILTLVVLVLYAIILLAAFALGASAMFR